MKPSKLTKLASCLSLAALMGLSACTKEIVNEKIIKEEQAEKEYKVEVNDKMDAEQLALAGEQLVGPATFMLAQKAFDMALVKDPTNKKAQFYTALLKPFMITKGFATRLKPVIRNHGDIGKHEKWIETIPNSPFRDFILDGKEDIKNIVDVQSYITEIQKAWNETRLFFINNVNLSLTINLNPHIFKEAIEDEIRESCVITRTDTFGTDFEAKCNYRGVAQRKINTADAIYLRQFAAGMVFMYTFYTTYSVENIDQLLVLDKDGRMTEEQRNNYIEDNLPEVGKLRKDHQLKNLLDLGSDYAAAANWALKYQTQLCPKGYGERKQRPGFLFSQGFCVENMDKAKKDLAILEQALKGAVEVDVEISDLFNNGPHYEKAKVDYFAWVRNPVQDLRSIAPASYNKCGNAASLRDKTHGGLFPNGDAEKFLLRKCKYE